MTNTLYISVKPMRIPKKLTVYKIKFPFTPKERIYKDEGFENPVVYYDPEHQKVVEEARKKKVVLIIDAKLGIAETRVKKVEEYEEWEPESILDLEPPAPLKEVKEISFTSKEEFLEWLSKVN